MANFGMCSLFKLHESGKLGRSPRRCLPYGDKSIPQSHRIQFSAATLLIAMTLAPIVFISTYRWHEFYYVLSTQSNSRRQMSLDEAREALLFWTSPLLASFVYISVLSLWFAFANRHNREALVGGLGLSYPLFILLGPLAPFAMLLPFMAILTGTWLIARNRFYLGLFNMIFSTLWIGFFAVFFLDDYIAVFSS